MIKVDGLTKYYGDFAAVKDVSFTVPEGSIFGFVGPNGAGKSTTIKVLATLLEPTGGSASVAGIDVIKHPEAVRGLLGYMPDFFGVYDDLKVTEYMEFYAAGYGIGAARRKRVIADLLELVELNHKRDSYVDSLSRGMKQRLCLARSLVHDPKVLLLDEPASGLDPRARVEMRELLKELQQLGKTIIISSHILAELSELCDNIGIIERGSIVASGTVDEIMKHIRFNKIIKVRLLEEQQERAAEILAQMPGIDRVTIESKQVQASFTGEEELLAEALRALVHEGIAVLSFSEGTNNLEEIFMRVTKGEVN